MINEKGIKEIESFLVERLKDGHKGFTKAQLLAWADDAEYQMREGNPPTIEIKSCESVSGHTECFTVPECGIDAEIVELEEDE